MKFREKIGPLLHLNATRPLCLTLSLTCTFIHHSVDIGDNAVTSSIKIAQVFSELVGKKTRAIWKVYGGMLKYIINHALYLAHYDAYF